MKRCRTIKKYFPEALFNEISAGRKKQVEAHLRICEECASEFEKLSRTLEIMNRRERDLPDEDYWTSYWDSLTDRMRTKPDFQSELFQEKKVKAPHFILPKWTWQVAASLALLFVGFTLGRLIYMGQPSGRRSGTIMVGNQVKVPPNDGMIHRANRYIDRTKVILLALVNYDPQGDSYALSFPEQKKVSLELIQEAALLKGGLENSGRKNLQELVGELEIILLQIANLDAEQNQEGVDILQNGVDNQGILMKINLFQMRQEAADTDSRSSGSSSGLSKLI